MHDVSLPADEPQAAAPQRDCAPPDRTPSPLADIAALIAELERAQAGSAELDARIHFTFRLATGRAADVAALLIEHGVTWPTVEAVLDERVPAFTTSLDAALEGEAIELVVRSAKTGRWGAMQKAHCGDEILAWAATEPLARRLVAIRAWQKDNEERMRAEARHATRPPGPANSVVPQNGKEDWEVLF